MVAQAALGRQNLKGGQKVATFEGCGKHRACAVGQIVRFVDQHRIFACGDILAKITLQVHLRIKNVVVVTNNDVAELRKFELQLIRADIVFCREFLYDGAAPPGKRGINPAMLPIFTASMTAKKENSVSKPRSRKKKGSVAAR